MLIGECSRRLGEREEAAELLGSALAFFSDVNAASAIPECLQEIAAVALAFGDASTAASLLGASERRPRDLGTPLGDPPDWNATVAAAQALFGDTACEEAWRRGAALDESEAIELALAATTAHGTGPPRPRPGASRGTT